MPISPNKTAINRPKGVFTTILICVFVAIFSGLGRKSIYNIDNVTCDKKYPYISTHLFLLRKPGKHDQKKGNGDINQYNHIQCQIKRNRMNLEPLPEPLNP